MGMRQTRECMRLQVECLHQAKNDNLRRSLERGCESRRGSRGAWPAVTRLPILPGRRPSAAQPPRSPDESGATSRWKVIMAGLRGLARKRLTWAALGTHLQLTDRELRQHRRWWGRLGGELRAAKGAGRRAVANME